MGALRKQSPTIKIAGTDAPAISNLNLSLNKFFFSEG